ncbi:hypothetical protein PIB30_031479 [Stylosanthes scabra]|uniref:F-box protein n=1 Tax=Stylosanthes scabra TaxID=79078 RepID=A0ABU6VA69_9FABA|nr:hypothetical protein [Stylosanthes scabra]
MRSTHVCHVSTLIHRNSTLSITAYIKGAYLPKFKNLLLQNLMDTPPSPPWEVLVLVAHYLDPKTLAIASCVSSSWLSSMSSDHLWIPFLTSHFPSLSNLPSSSSDAISCRRLFGVAHSAAKRRRKNPEKPKLSLADLVFAVSISAADDSGGGGITVMKPGESLVTDPPGVFCFDVGFGSNGGLAVEEGVKEVKITWNVILKGWREVFTMMDCKGKICFKAGGEGCFSIGLPAPGCCSSSVASAVVADMNLGMIRCDEKRSNGKVKVEVNKVSVGILSVVGWRYIGVEHGLRYLQHFLLT